MGKASLRDRILEAGLGVMFRSGYRGASVRDICTAAGAPHGSFTNHFGSKEEFAAEVLDIKYWEQVRDSDQFLAPVIPILESGRTIWRDAWDQPYLLDRRDEADRIVFALRSSHVLKEGTLGIEIIISRADGRVIERKELWR